jgi:hypothetical protein
MADSSGATRRLWNCLPWYQFLDLNKETLKGHLLIALYLTVDGREEAYRILVSCLFCLAYGLFC